MVEDQINVNSVLVVNKVKKIPKALLVFEKVANRYYYFLLLHKPLIAIAKK